MAHTYRISEFGLKLIKAYEGFRAVETTLVSGQKVIGYGHLYTPGDMAMLTKKRAEALLRTDLGPYEALVNNNVYAPLSQSQFDALVSLSFNIGEEAFLNSSVLYHLNTGQPLAAAAGFDEWRKSVIGGKTYIVDALVRRRTAEKALFLRPPTGIVATPRHELPPARVLDSRDDDGATEMFENPDTSGLVKQVPYADDNRDGQTDVLVLNNTVADDDFMPESTVDMDAGSREADIRGAASDKNPSPIAMAAAEVSERLDRLIDHEQGEDKGQPIVDEYSVQTSVPPETEQGETEQADATNEETGQKFPTMRLVEMDIPASVEYNLQTPAPEVVEDKVSDKNEPVLTLIKADEENLTDDQTVRYMPSNDLAPDTDVSDPVQIIPDEEPDAEPGTVDDREAAPGTSTLQNPSPNLVEDDNAKGFGAYFMALVIGLLLLAGGLWKMLFAPSADTGELSVFMVPVAILVGGLMLLGGVYYLLKAQIHRMVN